VTNAIAFKLMAARQSARPARRLRSPAFVRDVDVRYLMGLIDFSLAMALAIARALASIVLTVVLALIFVLGPSPRNAHDPAG
jgi:hypothetical protein